ncbi:hypothetical protein LOD99_15051 [Oopsacas minuta]|uniref:EGF-like domain-containing protein n=1 Tax=Oopsacas minuta TaxID=111878 RepID=A0AAV7KFB4_9METZ|nr:hypothetical protein LOD99_15051 [Oopsacas minuta]
MLLGLLAAPEELSATPMSLRWTSVVIQYRVYFISSYCLEPSRVYRSSISTPSLYTNCTDNGLYSCFSGTVICPKGFICRDTPTGAACTCEDGYILHSTGECTDEDECKLEQNNCEQNCKNTIGSYECHCDIGYVLGDDGISCLDIDECIAGTDICTNGKKCINTPGDYICTEGECIENCVNSTCKCCAGYRLDNNSLHCVDVDECVESIDNCQMNCQNTEGSFQCSCSEGFQLTNDTECLDIDECLTNNGDCQDVCMNLNGSFYCLKANISTLEYYQCDEYGYPKYCTSLLGATCECCKGYRMEDGLCLDIDECEEQTYGCEMLCLNTNGSYNCACEIGYQLANQTNCIDINECLDNNGGCMVTCLNNEGSFSCLNTNFTNL